MDTHSEEQIVQLLGKEIGFGRVMQLAEQLWRVALSATGQPPGGEIAVYCCARFPVPCPDPSHEKNGGCKWCCGAGRVTEHVAGLVEEEKLGAADRLKVYTVTFDVTPSWWKHALDKDHARVGAAVAKLDGLQWTTRDARLLVEGDEVIAPCLRSIAQEVESIPASGGEA